MGPSDAVYIRLILLWLLTIKPTTDTTDDSVLTANPTLSR